MSTVAAPFQIIQLKQPATAIDKTISVNLGWRPKMVWVINYKVAGAMGIAIDGIAAPAGGSTFGFGAAMAAVGSDGITFHDNGFKLGKDAALIKVDAAVIVCIAFRVLNPIAEFALSAAKASATAYGSGKQFEQDALSLSDVSVSAD